MTISGLHTRQFNERLNVADSYSFALMKFLNQKNHFQSVRKSSKEEDLDGVDWWVIYPDENQEVPIQFKLRDKQKDIPVCRFQPFWGINHAKTVVGRDFRGLRDSKCKHYYVGVRNGNGQFTEIYSISCQSLKSKIDQLDQEWQTVTGRYGNFALDFFEENRVNSWLQKGIWNKRVFSNDIGEVWWKKNGNEKSPKFNMYIPYECKEWDSILSNEESSLIESYKNESN